MGADRYVYKIERDTIVSGTTYHLVSQRYLGGYGHEDYHAGSSWVYPPSDTS